MENNNIYKVMDVRKILKKFSLTVQDKIFIVGKTYKSSNELRFFVLECNEKMKLLVKTKYGNQVYKLKCSDLPSTDIYELLLTGKILKSKYKLQKECLKIKLGGVEHFIPIVDIPYHKIFIHNKSQKRYRATIYIKNLKNKYSTITTYGENPNVAKINLIHTIYDFYDFYLEKECKKFNSERIYIHTQTPKTIIKITNNNLDTALEKHSNISHLSDELDIDMET